MLLSLRTAGFSGAPVPAGFAADGRERLEFIEGDVPLPPYPDWAQSGEALASVAVLMRRFHDASGVAWGPDLAGLAWSRELADPAGGAVVCHNDVCLENLVFRDGVAIALLDFDFAAPGRPVYDLAQFARLCVPIDDEINAARLGWEPADKPARLRLVADSYGLDLGSRRQLLEVMDASIARGGEFVRRRVEAGDPNFIAMWEAMGGGERFDRRRRWWAAERQRFAAACG
ncbi:MAG TPA: phosphotransferase [Streptosporangiaceae bacterium]